MTGTIPDSYSTFTAMTQLHIALNSITGSLPLGFSTLGLLVELNIGQNSLTGTLPPSFAAPLGSFQCHQNSISGSLPALPNSVSVLNVYNNSLTGSIPLSYSILTRLSALSVQFNSLTGSVPLQLSLLTSLTRVSLQMNQFTGVIPQLATNVRILDASYNQLSGAIQSYVSTLTLLTNLALQSNALSGSLPLFLRSTLTNIVAMNLCMNQLIGTVPSSFLSASVGLKDNLFDGIQCTSSNACSYCGTGTVASLSTPVACSSCNIGQFQNITGQSSCLSCSLGSFQNSSARSSCFSCDVGYFCNTTSMSVAWPCPIGQFSNAAASTACTECAPGSFQNSSAKSSCFSCDVGYFCNTTSVAWPCPIGQFSNATASTACIGCAPGSFQNSSARSSCFACDVGYFCNTTSMSVAWPCPAGQFNNATAQTACIGCAPGSFQASLGTTVCQQCTAGYQCPNDAMTAPQGCSAGYAAAAGALQCIQCAIGYYSGATAASCTPCSAGMRTTTAGSTSISDCVAVGIDAVVPNNGPFAGSQTITLLGRGLGAGGSDITSVTLGGVSCGTISGQTVSSVTCVSGASGSSGAVTVALSSATYGPLSNISLYTYNPAGSIIAVLPPAGPLAGGNTITISGTNFCNGSDITTVTVNAVAVTVLSQSATRVLVQAPSSLFSGPVDIVMRSEYWGQTVGTSAYIFNGQGNITTVIPDRVPTSGNTAERTVTIHGNSLGSGSDITAVSLAGYAATIVSQTVNHVVVIANSSVSVPLAGTVVVGSISIGQTARSSSFSFMAYLLSSGTLSSVEGGAPVTVSVSLSAAPAVSVLMSVTLGNCPRHFLSSSSPLTFNNGNYNVPQSIAISSIDNFIVDGPATCAVSVVTASSDALFNNLTTGFTASLTDNDIAGIRFDNGSLVRIWPDFTIIEGQVGWIDVTLKSQPVQAVQLSPVINNLRILTNISSLTFDDTNWNSSQRIYLLTVDNSFVDGAQWVAVRVLPSSIDPVYSASSIATTANVLVVDDDGSSTVQVSPALHNTTEGQASVTLYAFLAKVVSGPLSVSVTTDSRIATVSPSAKTMTNADVFVPSLFTISPVQNAFVQGDQYYGITFDMSGSGVSQQVAIWLWNIDDDVVGLNCSKTAVFVNETGSSEVFYVRPTSQPVQPLIVSVSTLNRTIATAQPSFFNFTDANWQIFQAVTVTGVRQLHSVNVSETTNISLAVTSGEVAYTGLKASVQVTNVDIHWPNYVTLTPELVAVVGSNITVFGDFMLNAYATVSNLSCTVFDVSVATYMTFQTPRMNVSGTYQNVTVYNPDGGWQFIRDAVFYTEDCPHVGFFGRGIECTSCPTGGLCPGGYRIWPLPGYWTPNEFSGVVFPCIPSVACIGGRGSECAIGYMGNYCGTCSDGFYRDNANLCSGCASQLTVAILLLIQFSFIALFVILAAVLNDSLSDVAFAVANMRGLWLVTNDLTDAPEWAKYVLSILSLFAADLNFSQPGCSGVSTFSQLWGVNVGVCFLAIAVLLVIVFLKYKWQHRGFVRYMSDYKEIPSSANKDSNIVDGTTATAVEATTTPSRVDTELASYTKAALIRASRCVFAFMMFIFGVLVVKAFEGVNCISVGGSLRLSDSLDTQCFTGDHWAIFIASIAILALCLWVLLYSTSSSAKIAAKLEEVGPVAAGFALGAMDDFEGRTQIYANAILTGLDSILALFTILFSTYSNWLFIGKVVCLGGAFLFVCIFRPFAEWWKFVSFVTLCVASLLTTFISLLPEVSADSTELNGRAIMATVVVALMLLYIAFLLLLGVLQMLNRWLKRQRTAAIVGMEDSADKLPSMGTSTHRHRKFGAWGGEDAIMRRLSHVPSPDDVEQLQRFDSRGSDKAEMQESLMEMSDMSNKFGKFDSHDPHEEARQLQVQQRPHSSDSAASAETRAEARLLPADVYPIGSEQDETGELMPGQPAELGQPE
eukprot:TRINITY_DN225_c0_g2_i5.p1 TRINITY_DN225_c0_g2~~TRINITY_DN225_c0_g2_i5.p1  ORF type:complete len:1943 (-),score=426.69 TRINITY_DN225_c0_g2_i5:3476-9304(-)